MHSSWSRAATRRPSAIALAVALGAALACHAGNLDAQVKPVKTAKPATTARPVQPATPATVPAPATPPPPLAVRLVEVGDATASGLRGSAASGVILELENRDAGLELTLDTASVRFRTTSGATYPPSFLFFIAILKGTVEPSSLAGTQLQGKTIRIGDKSYEAFKSMATMAVAMQNGVGIKYIFRDLAILQLGFVLPVARDSLVGMDIGTQSIDLARTPLDLSGLWEGHAAWPAMTFTLSARVDENSMFLGDARVVVECLTGTPATKAELTSSGRTRINRDGTFTVEFGQSGAVLTGQFVGPDVLVSGDMRGGLSAQCGTTWVKVAGKWKGSRRSR